MAFHTRNGTRRTADGRFEYSTAEIQAGIDTTEAGLRGYRKDGNQVMVRDHEKNLEYMREWLASANQNGGWSLPMQDR